MCPLECEISYFFLPPPLFPLHLKNKHMKHEVWGSADASSRRAYVCVGALGLLRRWDGGSVGWSAGGWGGLGKIENSCDLFFPPRSLSIILFSSLSLLRFFQRRTLKEVKLQPPCGFVELPPPTENSLKRLAEPDGHTPFPLLYGCGCFSTRRDLGAVLSNILW